jgi:hypothetical protein
VQNADCGDCPSPKALGSAPVCVLCFPCQSTGTPQFGEISEFLPILQKGDNFPPPPNGQRRQRYMAEFLRGMPSSDGGKPRIEFLRDQVAE